jgi:hypothetical protein
MSACPDISTATFCHSLPLPICVTTPSSRLASLMQVNVVYYLEDDTLAVTEPQVLNSGLPQQKVLRRHRVPRSALSSEVDVVTLPGMAPRDFVTWRDLRCVARLRMRPSCRRTTACLAAVLNEWRPGEERIRGVMTRITPST